MKDNSYIVPSMLLVLTLYHANAAARISNWDDFTSALKNGTPNLAIRFRNEYHKTSLVGLKDARATTLSAKLGYRTDYFSNFAFGTELVNVSSFFGNRYNSNNVFVGNTDFATILDPKGTGLTKVFLDYRGLKNTHIRIGRQELNFDDERFISSNNFRQYPQSFNCYSVKTNIVDYFTLFYAFLTHHYTSTGIGRAPFSLKSHLARVSWNISKNAKFTSYIIDHQNKDYASEGSTTFGTRYSGSAAPTNLLTVDFSFEIAHQKGANGNPLDYNANYFHLNTNTKSNIYNLVLGFEYFGSEDSSGSRQIRLPLGNPHSYLGDLDLFNTIPARGICDFYVKGGITLNEYQADITWHNFSYVRNSSSNKPGLEIDLHLRYAPNEKTTLAIGYGQFYPANNSVYPRVRKIWLTAAAVI